MQQGNKNYRATLNVLKLVFLEQLSNLPWNRHEEIVGWFDNLAPQADFGKDDKKTHRSRNSARTMTIFMSNMLHKELVEKLKTNTEPLSIITDESADVMYEPHLVLYISIHEVNYTRNRFHD